MTKIYVDDHPIEIKEGQNLLHAALSHGYDIPYFCWHPALGSVGACRQCAVVQYKDAADKKGRLVMSCMTPALEGARISIEHEEAKSFRASVIEWLMTNHPHDCPICDEGGECHLQDMTLMSGHNYRNFRFNKRTFKNQNLGPYVNHEMNRCITCYRCVRFYRDLAGGTDLNSFASSNRVYFGRVEDGTLESEFSGNLVEICPTGVFTDKQFKQNYTRKWDLQMAPSICQLCSLGCNITPGERGGILRRVQNRFHSEINGYFICDRGRFGHTFVNSLERLRKPLIRKHRSDIQSEVSIDDAFELAANKIASAKSIVGIGSPKASLESNFALRELVGAENFYDGHSQSDFECVRLIHSILKRRVVHTPSLKEIEGADAVLILGEDLTNTAPMMAFSVRQVVFHQAQRSAAKIQIPSWNDAAIRNLVREKKGPIHSFQVSQTKLDDVAASTFYAVPDRIAQIAFAIAHFLHEGSPFPKDISEEDRKLATQVAEFLRDAQNPVVIAGASLGSSAIVEAATNVALALKADRKAVGLSFVFPMANSLGLQLLETQSPRDLQRRIEEGKIELAIVLEGEKPVEKADCVLALDALNNRAVARADIAVPVASFAESTGSLVNNEGRVQRYYSVFAPATPLRESWRVLSDLGSRSRRASGFSGIDELTSVMGSKVPVLASFSDQVLKASYRVCGQKIPRATSEQSGRTALQAHKTVHEPRPPQDQDSPYSHTMEGATAFVPAAQSAFFWAPEWNSVQSLNKFQDEVGGPLKGGPMGVCLFEERENAILKFFAARDST